MMTTRITALILKVGLPKYPPKVSLELKRVSVLEAVKAVTKLAGFKYSIVDDGINVSGGKEGLKDRQVGFYPIGIRR